jgi:hypothetical protein
MNKKCIKCNTVKDLTLFVLDQRRKDLRTSSCKECYNKYRRDRSGCTPREVFPKGFKRCCTCKELKEVKEFHKYGKVVYWKCKPCWNKYTAIIRKQERDKVLEHYGRKCSCSKCPETKEEFLTIDHIQGKGHRHRKKIGGHINKWLIKNNFPLGFQVLCFNCNSAKGIYGMCPHEWKFTLTKKEFADLMDQLTTVLK